MHEARKRTILRRIHIILAIPIAGDVYSPFEELPNYAPVGAVCVGAGPGPDGSVDVERADHSPACFEKIGVREAGDQKRKL